MMNLVALRCEDAYLYHEIEIYRPPFLRHLPKILEALIVGWLDSSRDRNPLRYVLELGVRWYTVVYILDVYIECLPRVS